MSAPQNTRIRKNLEASLVALHRPSLNNQLETTKIVSAPMYYCHITHHTQQCVMSQTQNTKI